VKSFANQINLIKKNCPKFKKKTDSRIYQNKLIFHVNPFQ